ncbi:fimbrial assembly family protein [Synechococcus sp. BIOS-U3-1]|uniref:PilN domain-containing protein n=1 Tax=Synechococcus sp. BIOS-U3-1 TaxID=1400865 RepID=UPI0016480D12|nr:PilN domain-containing protein [Synechococcus sp. BIOS-U3-1]QNI60113.1 fimbrial assembly family protein [Synechococcus sp. BIOS-U3-1]
MPDTPNQQQLPDLLRERRLELGLLDRASPWQPMRPLLLRGALIGGVALLLSVGTIVWMGRIESQLQQQLQALLPFEQRVRSAEGRLRTGKQQLATVRQDNQHITEQLLAVPAGSPLLEQLSRVTPMGIQLEDVSVQNDQITLSGRVGLGGKPGPLERINALVLTLERLPISRSNGVKVLKVNRDDGEETSVRFSLDWLLDPKVQPSIQQLQQLGATGLVQRYRLLEQQGVAL